MPNYSYLCDSCTEEVIENRRIDDRDKGLSCPTCGSEMLRKLDTPGKIVRGTKKGFYNSNADGIK